MVKELVRYTGDVKCFSRCMYYVLRICIEVGFFFCDLSPLFWSCGNILSFKTSIRQGSSHSDSSTDRRGTCGRKIRLKCAGCNRCGGWVKQRGKWCSSRDEFRGDALGRRWLPSWLTILPRHTASPTRWSQVKIKTSYSCCQYHWIL